MVNINAIVQAVREGQIKFYIDGKQLMVKDRITNRELPIGTERREFHADEQK